MKPLPLDLSLDTAALAASLQPELQQLAAEAMGWRPLDAGVYVRQGALGTGSTDGVGGANSAPAVVHVVGLPDLALAGLDVLLLQG